jgi:large subunit ribosomal protein L33
MRDLITLVCDTCKRKNYTSTKNKKKTTEKLALKKFCPPAGPTSCTRKARSRRGERGQ